MDDASPNSASPNPPFVEALEFDPDDPTQLYTDTPPQPLPFFTAASSEVQLGCVVDFSDCTFLHEFGPCHAGDKFELIIVDYLNRTIELYKTTAIPYPGVPQPYATIEFTLTTTTYTLHPQPNQP